MSQQKDSNQGVELDKPTAESADETNLESSSPAGQAPEDTAPAVPASEPAADSAESDSVGDTADTVVLGKAGGDSAADTDTDSTGDTVALGKGGEYTGRKRAARESASGATDSDSTEVDTPRRVITLASIALLAVAAVAAAWFGGTWIIGGLLRDKPRADARDAALTAAQQAAINLTSMNLTDIDGSLTLARSSMTGDLLDATTKNEAQIKKTAADSNVNTTSKVVGGSVTELNSERDQAAALVVLEVTESGTGKPANRLRYTWSVDVVLKDGVWKADQVQAVADPVTIGAPAQTQQTEPQPTTPQQPAPQPGN